MDVEEGIISSSASPKSMSQDSSTSNGTDDMLIDQDEEAEDHQQDKINNIGEAVEFTRLQEMTAQEGKNNKSKTNESAERTAPKSKKMNRNQQRSKSKAEKRKNLANPDMIVANVLSKSAFRVPNLSQIVDEKLNAPDYHVNLNKELKHITYDDTTLEVKMSVLPTKFEHTYTVNIDPCAITMLPCIYELPERRVRFKRKGKQRNKTQHKSQEQGQQQQQQQQQSVQQDGKQGNTPQVQPQPQSHQKQEQSQKSQEQQPRQKQEQRQARPQRLDQQVQQEHNQPNRNGKQRSGSSLRGHTETHQQNKHTFKNKGLYFREKGRKARGESQV